MIFTGLFFCIYIENQFFFLYHTALILFEERKIGMTKHLTLERPRVWEGKGVSQNGVFMTEDYPLPVWCYWSRMNEDGAYQSIQIQIPTPDGWSARNISRGISMSSYSGIEKTIMAAECELVRWGRAMYGDEFEARYELALKRSWLWLNSHEPESGVSEDALQLELPEGVYCRVDRRKLQDGTSRQRVRIVATWREGEVGRRDQKEKSFEVGISRTLEAAIVEACGYRTDMLMKHSVYRSRYDTEK